MAVQSKMFLCFMGAHFPILATRHKHRMSHNHKGFPVPIWCDLSVNRIPFSDDVDEETEQKRSLSVARNHRKQIGDSRATEGKKYFKNSILPLSTWKMQAVQRGRWSAKQNAGRKLLLKGWYLGDWFGLIFPIGGAIYSPPSVFPIHIMPVAFSSLIELFSCCFSSGQIKCAILAGRDDFSCREEMTTALGNSVSLQLKQLLSMPVHYC